MIDKDVDQTAKVYCQWRWILGILALIVSLFLHFFMLPRLNLTMLAAKNVVAILASTVLSIQILGEVFIWKYDLPALILISAGCATVVLFSSTT